MSSACDTCPSKNGCTSQDSCPSANGIQKDPLAAGSSIKTVIGVASGKGGVGKSFVTSVLAVQLARKGYKVGIMDADITGPSIPQSFGLTENLRATDDQLIVPAETKTGIKAVSVNLVLENKEAPVIWRGPVLSSLLKQFWARQIGRHWMFSSSTCRREQATSRSQYSSPCPLTVSSSLQQARIWFP